MSGSCWLQGWTCDTCVFGFVGSAQQHPLLMHCASRLIAFADIELQVIDVVAPSPLSVTPYVTPVQAEEGNRSLTGGRKTVKVGSQIHHSSWSLMISGCARLQEHHFLSVQFLKRSDKYEVFLKRQVHLATTPTGVVVLILFALLHASSTFSRSWINHCKIWRSN